MEPFNAKARGATWTPSYCAPDARFYPDTFYQPTSPGYTGWVSRKRVICPPGPRKYNESEWTWTTRQTFDTIAEESAVAEHLASEAFRAATFADEVNSQARAEVEERFKQRLTDLNLFRDELSRNLQSISDEVDALGIYRTRIWHALANINKLYEVDNEIIELRNCRIGIDLVRDSPELEIEAEMKAAQGIKSVLQKAEEEVEEQMRILRKTRFHMGHSLLDKESAFKIDCEASKLHDHSENLSKVCDEICLGEESKLDESDVGSWDLILSKNREKADKAVLLGRLLRASIDSILRSAYEDIQKQVCATNSAFFKRTKALIEAKAQFQEHHSNVGIKIGEIQTTICMLRKAFDGRESSIALAETRLHFRTHRPRCENIRDAVERSLLMEVSGLTDQQAKLNEKILQAQQVLKSLNRTLLELEEAINVKTNSIAIDEAQVMPLRQTLFFTDY